MVKKTPKKRIKLIHIFLLFLFVYVGFVCCNQNKMLSELESKKEKHIVEINQLKTEIEDLNVQIESSNSLEFIERIAREDLGMVKPREIVYIDKNKKNKSVFRDD